MEVEMEKVRLGRSELKVTRIGFGGIPIQRLNEEGAVAVVKKCIDLGINYLDTAHNYTTSEGYIGKAIRGRRKDLILATKSGARTKEGVEAELAQSLKALGTDYIDLYQFHNVSDSKNLERVLDPKGPMGVVNKAMKDGVIKHVGITCHAIDGAKEAVKTDRFETVMFPFNFMASEPGLELLELAKKHDVGFIAMKPLSGGMLTNATLSFKYLLQFPEVIPIVGIEKTGEIEEIVQLLGKSWKLTRAEKAEMKRLKDELGSTFCRRCDYCQPCTAKILISTVMVGPSFVKRMPAERLFGPGAMLTTAMSKVEECTDCGECETRCPYKLPIREIMKERLQWFKEAQAEYLKKIAHE
jgi:uncharacterized protein